MHPMHINTADQFQPFPMTIEGYHAACQYLRDNGRHIDEEVRDFLTKDGQTVIQLTNDIRKLKGHYAAFHAERQS